ncbi:MAG: hypothetical protein ACPIA7_06215 [Akkermansiaceae bacterium]
MMQTSNLQLKTAFFILLFLLILPQAGKAQSEESSTKNNTSETTGPKRFWQADLPRGSYIVALDRITSISQHAYIIDGNINVTEVVIDTTGNSLARFYYLEPVLQGAAHLGAEISQRGKALLNKVNQRTGVDTEAAVIKQYPSTTHAKTVEFHISDTATLNALLESARTAWINGRGKKFVVNASN